MRKIYVSISEMRRLRKNDLGRLWPTRWGGEGICASRTVVPRQALSTRNCCCSGG